IASLKQHPYDLIFMDVQMPEMDGLEATRRIRQDFAAEAQPRIVAMTANATAGDRDGCLAAGMDDYISKPVRPDDLARMLHSHISTPHIPNPMTLNPTASLPLDANAAIDRDVLDALREAVGGEDADAFVLEVIAEFLDLAPQHLAGIREAIAANAPDHLRHHAHTLKSTSATVGASELADLCLELETQGRSGHLPEADELAVLNASFSRTRAALQAMLPANASARATA
ncbi:MAG: response regulator, partial [Cyanobacteria bacterium J06639_1]